MKKIQATIDVLGNSTSFKNPVCQDTFDSLPRIYGSLKQRIQNSKLQFYEQIHKRSLAKLSKSREKSPKSDSSLSAIKHSIKKQQHGDISTEGDKQTQRKIIFKKVTKFSDKYSKLPLRRKDDKKPRIKSIYIDDQEARSRVKFNTLHSLFPSLNTSQIKQPKPQTLSELIDDKISKSVGSMNPLMHLYRNKSPHSPFSHQLSIKEQSQDQSPTATINRQSETRQIKPNHRYKYQTSSQNENQLYKAHKRIKTQPSDPGVRQSGVMTQFSKRLAHKSRARDTKEESHIFLRQSTKIKVPKKEQYQQFIEKYTPVSQGFNLKNFSLRQNFKIIAQNQSVYFGLFEEKKQGFGVLISKDTIFEGYFDNDLRVKGCQITFDGKYVGKFNKKGYRHGKGKFQWNNGQLYEGDWEHGRKHGYGTWKSPSGDHYEGQWVKGRQQGNGVHRHKASVYKGQFLNSLKHGQGQEQFKNGDCYKGKYQNGKPSGKGRYDWSDGSYYQGQFRNGYREGQGVLRQFKGSLYKAKVSSRKIQNTVLGNKSQKMVKNTRVSSRRVSGLLRQLQKNDLSGIVYIKDNFIEIKLGKHQRR